MKTEQKLWDIIYPVKKEIYISIFLATLSTVGIILSLVFISFVLVGMIENTPLKLFSYDIGFSTMLLIIVGTITLSFITKQLAFVFSHIGSFKLEEILRIELMEYLGKAPLGKIITNGSGVYKKVLLDDVQNLHAFVADSIPMIAKSYIGPFLSFGVMLIIDYRLAFAGVFILIFGFLILSIMMKDSVEHRERYEKSQSEINKVVIEFVQAMTVVRTFDDGTSTFNKYNTSLNQFRKNLKNWIDATSLSGKLGLLILSPLIMIFIIMGFGLYLLSTGSIQIESIIVASFLMTGMSDSLMPMMWMNEFIKKSQSSALRIFQVLDEERLEEKESISFPKDSSIQFKNVTFAYNKEDKNALENVSFEIRSKEVVGFVGPSGGGKSTVGKLLSRFWDISQGEILLGGVNIKDLSFKDLMNHISFVSQETFLFNDTILNNLLLAKPNSTLDEVESACKSVQIHDFIISLPDGYQTIVGDRGASLSGGQKQRITIARAILKDSPILILDEATSSSDLENEVKIVKALASLGKNKTVLIIAHRLSTIEKADKIIVLEKGEVLESGSHKELIKKSGQYFNLVENDKLATNWDLEKGSENE
ncbi:MAG: ABC transporter ATP-binding protein/permease [Campylobacterales bacterium]|nr:ABC transporter ATP-binding protein/permease [Campylobacterales bacterium]